MKQRLTLLAFFGVLTVAALAFSLYQLVQLSAPAHAFAGTALQDPPDMSDVRLTDDRGESRALGDWRGKNMLVFFGFTHCPDVCPLTMSYLGALYEDLGEPDNLQVVLITVDPERDTPEVIGNYVRNFHPSFRGLTGDRESVDAAAARFYIGHGHAHDGMYVHTDTVALLDGEGRMRYIYNQDSMLYLEDDLRHVLAQRSW